jgi:hypothetical protein
MIKITENVPIIKMGKSSLNVTKYNKYYALLVLPSTSEPSEILKFLLSLNSSSFSDRKEAIPLIIHHLNAKNPITVGKDMKSHQIPDVLDQILCTMSKRLP